MTTKTILKRGAPDGCYYLSAPDRIHVAFDDHHLVANVGLILPVTLAHYLRLGELEDCSVDLGDSQGRVNADYKLLTLVRRRWPVETVLITPTRCALAVPSRCWAAQ